LPPIPPAQVLSVAQLPFASKKLIQGPGVPKKIKQEHASSEMKRLFPSKSLARPQDKKIGDPNQDYGGHAGTLNILTELEETTRNKTNWELGLPEIKTRIGHLSVDVTFENNQKLKNSKTTLCLKSKKVWPYIKATEKSLKQTLEARGYNVNTIRCFLQYLRVSAVSGALTFMHTDLYHAFTHNYVMFLDAGCHLRIHIFPKFCISVVVLFGRLYKPVGYSTIYGIPVYGLPLSAGWDKFDEDKHVTKLLIPTEELSYFHLLVVSPMLWLGQNRRMAKTSYTLMMHRQAGRGTV
jgi:hypothetical protein